MTPRQLTALKAAYKAIKTKRSDLRKEADAMGKQQTDQYSVIAKALIEASPIKIGDSVRVLPEAQPTFRTYFSEKVNVMANKAITDCTTFLVCNISFPNQAYENDNFDEPRYEVRMYGNSYQFPLNEIAKA